ncbi:zinc finger Ran-binding domain-containing protein [candidate division KSB1 bacterium]|nr:zinc finger Ran-binding domain-containing protein [candidate division KSB1 bacterium]
MRATKNFFSPRAGVALCFLALPLWAQENLPQTPYRAVRPKPGDYCTVGNVPLDTLQDVALIVRGRRVPLHRTMVDSFMRTQEKYFSQKQPKGALFQEELSAPAGAALGGISSGWFLFGLYVLTALVFGGMSGYTAVSKGLKPIPHFFIGFFLSAFGYLYVLTRPAVIKKGEIPAGLVKVPATNAPVSCPACGYANHPSAKRCVSCSGKLEPTMESEVARAI